MDDASAVVDVSNSPSFEDRAVLEFFETSTRNLSPSRHCRRDQSRLHHQQHRVARLPAPQDHQEPQHFPNDDAVTELLWLAIRDIEDKRARQRAKEAGTKKSERKATGRLVEGAATPRLKTSPRRTRHRLPRPKNSPI
jgi:hypothetical protein